MQLISTKRFILAVVFVFALTPAVSASTVKEVWYMSRGKANMEIKNYKAAIEAFEKLIEIEPDNREAMKLLGLAYENQGLTTKAVEHYDKYLTQYKDDADIAFKQAKFLEWSRFSYRRNDAVTYYRMGLAISDSQPERHRLAKLLSENKEALAEALKEYKILIDRDPQNRTIGDEYRKLLLWDEQFLDEAIKEFERAEKLYPNDLEIRHQLALLYNKDDHYTDKAILEYSSLVAQQPENLAIREDYARVLAKSDSHFKEAKKEYEYVLSQRDSYGTRLAYTDLISQKKSLRKEALNQYRRLLKQKPDQTAVRLKYAALLGMKKKDLDSTITQYKIVLEKHPKNVTAHQQIAHAYAWKGDNDRSIYHTNLALQYQPQNSNASRLKTRMMKGREPKLTAALSMFTQSGGDENYDMNGLRMTAGFRTDLTPFITGQVDLGYESYWKGTRELNGNIGKFALQYRPDSRRTWTGSVTHHAFNTREGENEFDIQYALEEPTYTVTPGFKRSLKYNSLLSLGSPDTYNRPKNPIGAARANILFCRFEKTTGSDIFLRGEPYAGFIQTQSSGNNLVIGADFGADYEIMNKKSSMMALVYQGQLEHYEEDYSGFVDQDKSPYPGGYFSPKLFWSNTFALAYRHTLQNDAELNFRGGPSVQFIMESSNNTYVGADLSLYYLKQLKDSLYIKAQGDYNQVADVYSKFTFSILITYHL